MPRQQKDGSVQGERAVKPLDDLFENVVTDVVGDWDWAECNTRLMAQAFNAINKRGDLMSLATNRAHTAGKVNVRSGGTPYGRWFNTYEEADAWFARAAQAE